MTQEEALKILKTGANVFLTGEPGSGKTHTINRYCAYLREHGIEPAITASTGIAATHVGGMTVHSWSGIGVKKTLSMYDLEDIAGRERVARRVALTTTLIIDEVSMLDNITVSMLDAVCRRIKNSERPFGGLQVVFVGDFFQLPPVSKRTVPNEDSYSLLEDEGDLNFAFTSPAWERANPIVCFLSEQHRQEDEAYLALLTAIRSNDVGQEVHELLKKRTISDAAELRGITKLYSHNVDVDRVNTSELSSLSGGERVFSMVSRGAPMLVESLKKGCLSPERLVLKRGAIVMFTKNNFEEGYFNGTLGEVVDFSREGLPIVKIHSGARITVSPAEWSLTDGGKVLAKLNQLPLRLAWAITVHKSQGMSLDRALVDLSQAFEYGQGYVALSRLRTLLGLHLIGYNARALEVHPALLEHDSRFRQASELAAKTFATLPQEELAAMRAAFIKASGGSREKKNKTNSPSPKKFSVDAMREKHPNAYRPWTKEEDTELAEAFHGGQKHSEIAKTFGRKRGAISSRLKKLGLIDF